MIQSGKKLRLLRELSSTMEQFFYVLFAVLGVGCAALEFTKGKLSDKLQTTTVFNAFKNNYLVVYSLMMGELYCLCQETYSVVCSSDFV